LGETAGSCRAIEWYFLIIQARYINAELCCALHAPGPPRDLSKQQGPYKVTLLIPVDIFLSIFPLCPLSCLIRGKGVSFECYVDFSILVAVERMVF
jgi:hypothetical protein